MPTGISRLGVCGGIEWVASIFAAVALKASMISAFSLASPAGLHIERSGDEPDYLAMARPAQKQALPTKPATGEAGHEPSIVIRIGADISVRN